MSEAIGQAGRGALPRPLGIGEILSTAFRLYQRHWRTLLAIAAVVVVPLTLLQYLFGDWIRSRSGPSGENGPDHLGIPELGLGLASIKG
jgi:hypothetical protein